MHHRIGEHRPVELSISPTDAAERVRSADGKVVLLDCRTNEEVEFTRIDGSLHVPMHEIPHRLEDIDRDAHIIVYCHHGVRSQQVAAFLRDRDFSKVQSMTGGIDAWSLQVDSSLPRYN